MTKIAFFGHDASDAAIRRRIRSFGHDGIDVVGLTMRRCDQFDPDWENIDLGQTYDGAFLQRLNQIQKGASIAAEQFATWQDADLIYARNLDMLACAFLAKRKAKSQMPVVYECLDVHRLLVREDPVGAMMRNLEKSLLKRCAGLVVSSPAFLRNHFDKYYSGLFRAHLLENKLAENGGMSDRPLLAEEQSSTKQSLKIGWVGILRCQRSFDLLKAIADRFGERVEIKLHGKPARNEIAVFESEIEARPNMSYHGPYKAPEDLDEIYLGLDIVWAADFMEAGFNSVWLLPNRIYEGGYFGAPPVVVSGTETANWVGQKSTGFIVSEPLEEHFPALIGRLIDDRSEVAANRSRLLSLPEENFVEPSGTLSKLISTIISEKVAA